MEQEVIKNKGGRPKKKHAGGRPSKLTGLTLKKLEEAFAIGCSDEEACMYADISPQTLYNYQKKNPRFIERKEALKLKPVLKARQTVVNKVGENYGNAMDYLSRKRKDEFAPRSEFTGAGGKDLIPDDETNKKSDAAIKSYLNKKQ